MNVNILLIIKLLLQRLHLLMQIFLIVSEPPTASQLSVLVFQAQSSIKTLINREEEE